MSNTSNLDLERPDKGDSDWHTSLNSNFTKLDTGYGNNVSSIADLPEVYIETGTFNYTSGDTITLPKSVDATNEYNVTITPTSRAGAIGDIYVTKTTSNFVVYCSENNTTDTFSAVIYYIGDINSYGGSIYRQWYVSPDASITDHSDNTDVGSLAWVVSQIGASPANIVLPGNKTYTLTANTVTINDNIKIIPQQGAIFDGPETISFDSSYQICACLSQQIFGSSVTVVFTNQGLVSVKWFSVLGDDNNDDTAGIQSAIVAALSLTGGKLFFPHGTYKITSALTFVQYTGFIIEGESQGGTFIKQYTSDTPIFEFTKENTHSFKIHDLYFEYNTQQTSVETESVAIYFDFDTSAGSGAYNFQIDRCQFDNVFKGIAIDDFEDPTIWGCAFSNLYYNSTCTGPIIDAHATISQGKPNISARNIYIRADSIENAQPIMRFSAVKGLELDNIEYNQVLNGATCLVLQSGTTATIGSLRVDTATYTTNDDSFIDFSNSYAVIDTIQIGSATINITSGGGYFSILRSRGGADSYLNIGSIYLSTTTFTDGDAWVALGNDTAQHVNIGTIYGISSFALTNIVSQETAAHISVEDWNRPRISANNGDASVTITVGDEQVQMFETELTTNRTVTLPEHIANPTNVFHGLTYKIVRNATTPGTYTLTVQNSNSAVIGSLANDTNGSITVMYRRLNWVLIGQETW